MLTTKAKGRHPRAWLAAALIGFTALSSPALAAPSAEDVCGPLTSFNNLSGWPADYRLGGYHVHIVEQYHFPPTTEALIRPVFVNAGFGGDLAYTLRMIPNHHRALLTLLRLGERENWIEEKNMEFSYECYYERAIRFRPDDMVPRMIYAMFLQKRNRPKDAQAQLDYVASKSTDDPITNYALGTLYLEMKQYEKAAEFASRAYAQGHTNPGLMQALQKLGKWPATAVAPGAAASAAETASAAPAPAQASSAAAAAQAPLPAASAPASISVKIE